jgi:hypothetical protein
MIIQSITLLTTLSNFKAKLPKERKRASVSVLIPARNEASKIERTLKSLSEIETLHMRSFKNCLNKTLE